MRVEILNKKREQKRKTRIRKKIIATTNRPRLTVFRSNMYMYAQVIDDKKGITIAAVSEQELKIEKKHTRIQAAEEVGKAIAARATAKKILEVVFDKGSYKYHGRVRALAEAARKGGLKF